MTNIFSISILKLNLEESTIGRDEGKIISGCELINKNIVRADFHLKNNGYTLLKGHVLSPTGEVLPNVAIEVTIIDTNWIPPKKRFVGITFSHKDGSYAISIPIKNGYLYRIVPYST